MTATIEELNDGRTETLAQHSSADIPYLMRGVASEPEAKTAACALTPAIYNGMYRSAVEIVERLEIDGESAWKVIVRYEFNFPTTPAQEPQVPEPTFSFDTGGGTQHITQSIETLGLYGPSATNKLCGAIGFDGENIEGVDITVPIYSFTETHYFTGDIVTGGYKAALFALTGRLNADVFRGFAAGEVLFLGASGAKRGTDPDDLWEITFKFAAQPNRAGIMVGSIGPISKRGWDYMWVQYAPDIDDDKKQVIKVPVAVYVERVYFDGDFGFLGIGA